MRQRVPRGAGSSRGRGQPRAVAHRTGSCARRDIGRVGLVSARATSRPQRVRRTRLLAKPNGPARTRERSVAEEGRSARPNEPIVGGVDRSAPSRSPSINDATRSAQLRNPSLSEVARSARLREPSLSEAARSARLSDGSLSEGSPRLCGADRPVSASHHPAPPKDAALGEARDPLGARDPVMSEADRSARDPLHVSDRNLGRNNLLGALEGSSRRSWQEICVTGPGDMPEGITRWNLQPSSFFTRRPVTEERHAHLDRRTRALGSRDKRMSVMRCAYFHRGTREDRSIDPRAGDIVARSCSGRGTQCGDRSRTLG